MDWNDEGLTTLRDYLRFGVSRFQEAGLHYGHGTDNALDEAVALVLPTLHLPQDLPPIYLDSHLTSAERARVLALLQRRVEERRPVPYLTRRAWFAGLEFKVDERVLIPRSPIAELIERQLAPWVEPPAVTQLLDLCCGCGCIGIAAALHFPEAVVTLSDLSPEALAVAALNIQHYGLEDRVRWVASDLFAGLEGAIYDVILANPPYVDQAAMAALPEEYRHEPAFALAAGEDGLDLVLRILRDAGRHLSPQGILIAEVGASSTVLTECLPRVPFLWLDFERGGDGVFLLTAEQIRACQGFFESAMVENGGE
ncbi:MAG: 50S ribosomal protein L3 N(5)-glutamine methyltransferase [Pseudomonadota bacterium]